ncbi:isoleucine--tRNA ligase [Candidatus Woesearchaeota archaeon]|nr:MAG: isoleucine--tRNA ligase [Candidatus Woesearchaeota archaeon]
MQYQPNTIEPSILAFWKENKIYEKAKEKNAGGKKFYYLDGPPYTSGKVHLGTAWGKALRDSLMRYKRMAGFNVWDRAGFDTHGLPTAHAVEKKLGIKHKDEIPEFGVAKFIQECKRLCIENKEKMIEDFKKMGVWMGFDNPYITLDNSYIESEWWLIKKAHDNNRLYEGKKVMHWCAKCGTALAKHELEYKTVTDESIFLKFKVKGKEKEYLVIWTTTPWTIPFNLAVMANPEEEYVKAKVDGEIWILAGKLAGLFIQGVVEKKYEIIETFKGEELKGLEYEQPLYEELKETYDKIKEESPKAFTVVLSSEYVDASSGSGLVHCAPGCGPEDYEVGHDNKIPPFNNLKEDGSFPESMGIFKGWVAKEDDKGFIEYFDKKGILIAKNPVEHEYAHCWRCKSPVIFRTTKQWFFKIEDLKEEMRALNKNIKWVPDWAGSRQFDSWLENLRDNGITRQRYWGCPAPIWKCDKCGNYEVIGSVKELEEKSGQKAPEDLHIPDIDKVTIKCSCGNDMKRIPDILDVWVDAGVSSWACLDYPKREDLFKEWWPADFILEGKDQIRGWFNLLFIASMVSMKKPSYKAVYMHGFINDSQGRKMSKSLQNYILPSEVIDAYGSDTLRYYSIGGADPGLDLNYNHADCKLKLKNLTVFWNIHKFILDLARELKSNPLNLEFKKDLGANPLEFDEQIMEDMFGIEERFIFSKLNSTIKKQTEQFDKFQINETPKTAEELFLTLSRDYIQMVRDKAATGSTEDKKVVLYTITKTYLQCLKLMAPITPFITEQIWQNLREEFGMKEESVHLNEWPKTKEKWIDTELEEQFEIASNIVQAALAAREKAKISLRWPIQKIKVLTRNDKAFLAVEKFEAIIKKMTNCKEVHVNKTLPEIKEVVKIKEGSVGKEFGAMKDKIISCLTDMTNEEIINILDKQGRVVMDIEDKEIEIGKTHFEIIKESPENMVGVDFRTGTVYINTTTNDELLAEGYAREIMRRVQALRKKAGLEKQDRIRLYVQVDDELKEMLKDWEEKIKEKVGAEAIKIDILAPAVKHKNSSEEKIKDKRVMIFF